MAVARAARPRHRHSNRVQVKLQGKETPSNQDRGTRIRDQVATDRSDQAKDAEGRVACHPTVAG